MKQTEHGRQKAYPGENTDRHGIRLDVCLDEQGGDIVDLEPDQNSSAEDVRTLPRRVRFYHAKIDAGSLARGMEYSALRNVVVIFITTYDPFGLNRMVYTISNKCEEVPDMPYDDGAKTLFLYTKGTEGNPPEELHQLLHYMEDTRTENAVTPELRELHELAADTPSLPDIRQGGLFLSLSPKASYKIQREKTALFRFLWTFYEGIFYNENRSVSYKFGIFRDTREEEYIRKPMKEGIKWKFDVSF